jgi:hypothetical protein
VSASEAKQLVSQLASLAGDKPETAEKADKPDNAHEKPKEEAPKSEAPAESEQPPAEGGDAEEPLNRGLLLKFLSSVRQ